MNSKKICCIASSDIDQKVRELLDEIQSRIHLTIPVLVPNDSVVDYEVVISVLSDGARNDNDVLTLLKEASNLNKIFLPIIFSGSTLKNWFLKRRFKGPDLRAPYYSLNKTQNMLSFYSQLMSLSGSAVVGDPFGKVYTFLSDQDCQIIKNHDVIAEIKGGQSQNVTLYLGRHKLKIKCGSLDLTKDLTINVDNLETADDVAVNTRFIPDVKITSSMDFALYEGKEYITDVSSTQDTIIKLTPGSHKLKFQHPVHKNLNRYITIKIKVDENKGIVYDFPYSPKECSFD